MSRPLERVWMTRAVAKSASCAGDRDIGGAAWTVLSEQSLPVAKERLRLAVLSAELNSARAKVKALLMLRQTMSPLPGGWGAD